MIMLPKLGCRACIHTHIPINGIEGQRRMAVQMRPVDAIMIFLLRCGQTISPVAEALFVLCVSGGEYQLTTQLSVPCGMLYVNYISSLAIYRVVHLFYSCFAQSWKLHSQVHSSLMFLKSDTSGGGMQEYMPGCGEPAQVRDNETQLESLDRNSDSMDGWDYIFSGNMYIPTEADVGRVLKVLSTAVLLSNTEHILAGPVSVCSSIVLSSPPPPPHRPFRTCSPSGESSCTAEKFRVLSYNILAEVYATRQVCKPFAAFKFLPNFFVLSRCTLCVIRGVCCGPIVGLYC